MNWPSRRNTGWIASAGAAAALTALLFAQDSAETTVDDSPTALQLYRQAEDQLAANPAEAARLIQLLLEQYPSKLLPVDSNRRYEPARLRALALLRSHPELLERWQRNESATAERLLAEGELATVAETRPLTRAGIEALLRLAQADLEAGRLASAESRLAAIEPDSSWSARDRLFAIGMRALAGAALGQRGAADGAIAALESLASSDPSLGAEAKSFIALLRQSTSTAPALAAAPDTSQAWPRIWRLNLPNAPFARRYLDPDGPVSTLPTADQAAEEGGLLTVLPLVVGDTIYVSEGHTVSALDRLSRRQRWSRNLSALPDREQVAMGDLSEMVLVGDSLLLINGHASPNKRTGSGRLICLDAVTGATRWDAPLEHMDRDDSEGLFLHGAPAVVDDTVVVMARKVNSRMESVGYVLGFDLHDGSTRWSTHLASCGGIHLGGLRPFSTPLASGGSIYVASSLGAIARLDPATGVIRWLDRSSVPVKEAAFPSQPWEITAPVLTDAGLIAISPDQALVLVLDPETGVRRGSFPLGPQEMWGTPRYFLTNSRGDRIFAVGDDVIAFDSHDLTRPLWSLSKTITTPLKDAKVRNGIRGRVQVVDGGPQRDSTVIVPGLNQVVMLEATSGRVERVVDTSHPGNPVLAEGQLLLAGNDRLDCFMPLARAEQAIRNWISRDPSDPERFIALLDLGTQCHNQNLVFEGAIGAIASSEQAPEPERARNDILARLIDAVSAASAPSDADATRIFELAERVARTPAQQVTRRLSLGDWNERRGRTPAAVEAWQGILAEKSLRTAEIETPDGSAPASEAVLSRLGALAAAGGTGALAPRERAAEAAIQAAPGDRNWAELARAWMGTAAGAVAARKAAAQMVEDRHGADAFALLAASLRATSLVHRLDAPTQSVLAALVDLAGAVGWQDAASVELASLLARCGDGTLSTMHPPTTLRELLTAIDPLEPSIRRFPVVGTHEGPLVRVDGRMASLGPDADDERPLDRILLIQKNPRGRTISLRRTPSLEPIWEKPADSDDPVVLTFTDTIVLWQRAPGEEASLVALSADDGSVRWVIPLVSELFDRKRLLESGPMTISPRDNRVTQPSEILPVRVGRYLLLVRRNGDIACVDQRDGSTPWRRDHLFDEITGGLEGHLAIAAGTTNMVAIAGRVQVGNGVSESRIALLDPVHGDVVAQIEPEESRDLTWLATAPGPTLIAGTTRGMEAFSMNDGSRLWTHLDRRLRTAIPWTVAGDRLLLSVQRAGGMMRDEIAAVGIHDGTVDMRRFLMEKGRGWMGGSVRSVERIGDNVIVGFGERVMFFDGSGAMRGQDAIAVDHNFAYILPSRDSIIAIDPDGARANLGASDRLGSLDAGGRIYHLSRADGGRLVADMVLKVGEQPPNRWMLVDGGLVASAEGWTVSLPLAPESGR